MNKLFIPLLLASFLVSTATFAANEISQAQMLSLINAPKAEPYILLDVRSVEEFESGHVPGAINVPHTDIEQATDLLSKNKATNVILYCRSGRRAGIAADKLSTLGFSNLKHLSGDMKAWQANELPTETK